MKKIVRYFLYFFVLIIFLLQIGINIFFRSVLTEIVIKNFPNIELKYSKIYYIVPNIIFLSDLSVVDENFELNIHNGRIFFNPLSFIFKNLSYVLVSNFDNVVIKILSYETKKVSITNLEKVIEELDIKKIIDILPFKFKIKKGVLYYNGNILIKDFNIDFVRIKEKPTAKIYFDIYSYSVDMKLYCDNKTNRWNIDFEINPVIKMISTPVPEIKGKFFGFYDLKKQQQYKILLLTGNKKIILKGTFSFYPFILKGKVFGDILRGEYDIKNLDNILKMYFDGKIMLKALFNFNKETDIHTTLNFEKTNLYYKYDFVSYSENFVLKSF
jgi:hypothetical protein